MFLAVIRIRATAAPLNAAYTADEFEFYLSDSESKLLLTSQEGNKPAQAAATKLNLPHITASLPHPNSPVTLSFSTHPSQPTTTRSPISSTTPPTHPSSSTPPAPPAGPRASPDSAQPILLRPKHQIRLQTHRVRLDRYSSSLCSTSMD